MSEAADLLRAYRARYGWSQAEAAAETGVPLRTWQGWEAGKPMPQPPFLARLLREALNTPVATNA